jgi:hypothetical protein
MVSKKMERVLAMVIGVDDCQFEDVDTGVGHG